MRRDELRLRDLLENIDAVLLALAGRTRADLDGDSLLQKAVLYHLQTIGEASARASAEIQQGYPEVPWRQIRDIRNIIVHEYFSINLDIIWQTATEDLPQLREQITEILSAEFPEEPPA